MLALLATVAMAGERREQCSLHVEEGLRDMALGVVLTERQGDDHARGRDCLLAGSPIESCLVPREREIVGWYAKQRTADCRRWPEPVAACVLDLPEATGCDEDELPLWRLSKRRTRQVYGRPWTPSG